jgi:hypothetical protein
MLGKHLDGNSAIETCVRGFIDLTHPPRADTVGHVIGTEASACCQRHGERLRV